ncbi:hypothetical protein AB1K83_06350 [Sporosarcina sp. 179-K 3D1 HS]|uniref:hypothetical protein n=1 Tax=Sporosarcina sp. 179-K 3D1 HS TaxID=3232169 RepID=UPI0039A06E89
MDYFQLLNELKMMDDREAQAMARYYGIDLSVKEIRGLRPLLDEISFHWMFTGVPERFIEKVEKVIGKEKTRRLLEKYLDATK